jgi:hypothetical protein
MRIARLDMEAFKPPYSFVPTGSEPAEADSTALEVTDVQIEGHAQDITLRLYRQAKKNRIAGTALFPRWWIYEGIDRTGRLRLALFRRTLTGSRRVGGLLARAAVSVSGRA